jgi:hypothetical protein
MLVKFSIKIPDEYLRQIDKFMEEGLYVSRTEAIRFGKKCKSINVDFNNSQIFFSSTKQKNLSLQTK